MTVNRASSTHLRLSRAPVPPLQGRWGDGQSFYRPFRLVIVEQTDSQRRNVTWPDNTAADGGGIDNEVDERWTSRGWYPVGQHRERRGGGISTAGNGTDPARQPVGQHRRVRRRRHRQRPSGMLTVDDSSVSGNVAPVGADLYKLGVVILKDSTVRVIGPDYFSSRDRPTIRGRTRFPGQLPSGPARTAARRPPATGPSFGSRKRIYRRPISPFPGLVSRGSGNVSVASDQPSLAAPLFRQSEPARFSSVPAPRAGTKSC